MTTTWEALDRIRVEFDWQLVERDGVRCWMPPPGDHVAWVNGTRYETTRVCARALFLARGEPDPVGEAHAHFAGGWRGNTNDTFHAAVLRAFGEPVPEYPAELRAEHDAMARKFWGGVGRTAASLAGSTATAAATGAILEAGRVAADADGR